MRLSWHLQAQLNVSFGGARDEGLIFLSQSAPHFRALPSAADELPADVRRFTHACAPLQAGAGCTDAQAAAIDAAFEQLSASSYRQIPQKSAAWLQLRTRLPFTASRLFDLIGGSLAPPRAGTHVPGLKIPAYRIGAV